jgi:hypothetical protein
MNAARRELLWDARRQVQFTIIKCTTTLYQPTKKISFKI